MELVVFIGLPAAGKSTFFQQRFRDTHVHVSKDLMPRSASKEQRQRALVLEALSAGRSIVVDNVNARVADRAWLISQARAHGARVIGYFFDVAPRDCLARNRGREGTARVPPAAIFASAKRLERPTPEEGWDALFRVTPRHNDGDVDVSQIQVQPGGRV
jgi:predicted kinase